MSVARGACSDWSSSSGSEEECSSSGECGGGLDGVDSEPRRFQLEALFAELMQECRHSAPGARLSGQLRAKLERLPPETRRALVSRTAGSCAPLFVSARRGNAEICEYLLHVCDAPIEQRGVYVTRGAGEGEEGEGDGGGGAHLVTPLWAAAVAGRLRALRVLADAGAQLDATSDSGSTPLRSACFMSHEDVARELVSRGADVHRANHSGGTCLINAVQSRRLVALLLARGARPDAVDVQRRTALHYAAREHRVHTVLLLLARGADPRLKSRDGEDVLRTAALKGAGAVVALLTSRGQFPAAQAADELELLGASQLEEFGDEAACRSSWRHATMLRAAAGCDKPRAPPAAAAAAAADALPVREWRRLAELEALDGRQLRAHALLVALRVLGPEHKDLIHRVMSRGAACAEEARYRSAAELWLWALRLRVRRDTLLHPDTAAAAAALARLLLEWSRGRLPRAQGGPPGGAAARALRLLTAGLPPAQAALLPRPRCRSQMESFDRVLRCATHFLYLQREAADTPQLRAALLADARRVLALRPRCVRTGDTLLHLAVSRLNVIDDGEAGVFPCERTVRLLLAAGAGVAARNGAGCTALHLAALAAGGGGGGGAARALLAAGAHADQPTRLGDGAAALLAAAGWALPPPPLRCLAASALARLPRAPPPPPPLPARLRRFLLLHRADATEDELEQATDF